MSNESCLYAIRAANPNDFLDWQFEDGDLQMIMRAEYSIPVLWCSLFLESDLRSCSVVSRKGEKYSYPVYITSAEFGIQRAINRRSKFCRLFSENIGYLFDKWLELLKPFNDQYIHMDWVENSVLFLGENESIGSNLGVRAAIRAFESDLADEWENCFAVCDPSADFNVVTKQAFLDPRFEGRDPRESSRHLEVAFLGHHVVRKVNKKGRLEGVSDVEKLLSSDVQFPW